MGYGIKSQNTKKHGLKRTLRRFFISILALIIVFCGGVYKGIVKPWRNKSIKLLTTVEDTISNKGSMITVSTIEEVLKPASDLITMKYCYTDTDTYENFKQFFGKKVPFTTDKVVFTYDGYVSVGIDLADVEYDIDNDKKIINISLPEVKIVSNEIDHSSFKYPYESDSIFNNTDMGDYTELINSLKDKKAEDIKNNTEFMDSAKENTKSVLQSFLTISNATKDYTVNFK